MSKESSLKEEIGWLKVGFGLLVAIDASMIAWVAQNFPKSNSQMLALALIAILISTILIGLINVFAYERMRDLEAS